MKKRRNKLKSVTLIIIEHKIAFQLVMSDIGSVFIYNIPVLLKTLQLVTAYIVSAMFKL